VRRLQLIISMCLTIVRKKDYIFLLLRADKSLHCTTMQRGSYIMFVKIFILTSVGLFNTTNMLMLIWWEYIRVITITSASLTSNKWILLTLWWF